MNKKIILGLLITAFGMHIFARDATPHQPIHESTPFAHLSYEELKKIKIKAIEKGNISGAVSCLERLIKICNNLDELGALMLELADLFFVEQEFSKATMVYEKFASLYPGSEHAEYALYRAIVARFEIVPYADRDQTKTEEVIGLVDKFLTRETFTRYKKDVQQIKTRCYEQLFDTESRVCTFYAKRGQMAAVTRRLSYIEHSVVALEPSLEPNFLAVQAQIAELQDNKPLAEQKRADLHAKFPQEELVIAKNAEFSWKSWLQVWV